MRRGTRSWTTAADRRIRSGASCCASPGTIAPSSTPFPTLCAPASSSHFSFRPLPAEKRRAIVAVWDFCRAVDDAVDEAESGTAAAEVTRWRDELARCFDGGVPLTPQGGALQPLIPAFNLPRPAFEALIEGVEMDLHTTRYATFADLYEYCIRVASAVGLMCVEIFRCKDPRSLQDS